MPVKLLLIDDDEVDRQAIRRALARSELDAEVTEVTNAISGRVLLGESRFDCLLLDYRLPDMSGLDFLTELRAAEFPDLPIVMLTGLGDERAAVQAIRAGAQDYLSKDTMSPEVLGHSVTAAIRMMDLEQQRAASELDRERAVSSLRESERRFRNLFENAVVGIYRTTPEGGYLAANPAIAQMHGCETPSDFMAHFTDAGTQIYVDPGAREELTGQMRATGVLRNFECHAYRRDGSKFWMRESGRAVRDDNGNLLGYEGFVEDITELKEAEAALQGSDERFRSAFLTAPHGMALVAPDGRYLTANRAMCDFLGYDEEELLKTDFQTLTHPDDLNADLDYVRHALAGEFSCYQFEKRYVRKDGSVAPGLLSVALVRDTENQPVYFISQILDLTDRKEAETQLRQAQKMEAVGQLTGGVAHDFNNLLTIIVGNAKLLQRRVGDDESNSKQIDAIIGAVRRGSELTNRLLSFSRKEALEPAVVDTAALVNGMLELLERTLGETIKVEADLAVERALIYVDPNQFENALLNLATNARDAMPKGGTLTISTRNARVRENAIAARSGLTPGEYVILSVSDTGTGIPARDLERIFEPFFTTKDVGKGTGLGLSMVFGFARQSGGHVLAESQEGRGTTIRLYLPESSAVPCRPAGVGNSVTGREAANEHETILVVEDQAEVRAVAVAILEDLGYRVIEAENGPDALAKLETQPGVDLLFTDMIMPGGMNGHELAVKAKGCWPDLKVLYTSGYTDGAFESLSPDVLKAVNMLRKPYEDTALAQEVKEALNGKPQGPISSGGSHRSN